MTKTQQLARLLSDLGYEAAAKAIRDRDMLVQDPENALRAWNVWLKTGKYAA